MEYKRLCIKWFFYGMLLWIFTILQFMIFPQLKIAGVTPNLIPALVTAVAIFEGAHGGGAYGFVAGLFLDAFLYASEGFFALLLLLGALAAGYLARHLFRKTLLTTLLFSLTMLTLINLLYFIIFQLIPGRAGFMALLTVSVPEILYSMPFAVAFYFLARGVNRRWGKETPS